MKTYHVRSFRGEDLELANALTRGVRVSNGEFLRVKDARILRQGDLANSGMSSFSRKEKTGTSVACSSNSVSVLRLIRVAIDTGAG